MVYEISSRHHQRTPLFSPAHLRISTAYFLRMLPFQTELTPQRLLEKLVSKQTIPIWPFLCSLCTSRFWNSKPATGSVCVCLKRHEEAWISFLIFFIVTFVEILCMEKGHRRWSGGHWPASCFSFLPCILTSSRTFTATFLLYYVMDFSLPCLLEISHGLLIFIEIH